MVYDIIQDLKAESGKNAKIAILREHEDNELLKRVLFAALDPYTQYHIRKIPSYKASKEPASTLNEALDVIPALSKREVTGHAAADFLRQILEALSSEDADVLERVIKKNLDCGVQESTVNKVWPGLIPTYPCLLAKGFDEKSIKRMSWPAYSQLKADGMRVNAFVSIRDNGNHVVTFRARSGREVHLLGYLEEDIIAVAEEAQTLAPDTKEMVFDGELVVIENDGSIMERRKGNGILNKAIKGTISDKEASSVRMHAWDYIPLVDFRANFCETPYRDRWNIVYNAVTSANTIGVDLIEQEEVADLEEAEKHFHDMLARGEEGTLLKNPDSPWEDKRSYGLLKMKAEKSCDLTVVDWVEGTGKYTGMLGALVCRSNDGKVEVHVGSGFSDEQRQTLKAKDVIDKVVTVTYNERIKSKAKDRADVDSLFLPRFVEVREDKTTPNSSKEIK